jgi:hypothetical protein
MSFKVPCFLDANWIRAADQMGWTGSNNHDKFALGQIISFKGYKRF